MSYEKNCDAVEWGQSPDLVSTGRLFTVALQLRRTLMSVLRKISQPALTGDSSEQPPVSAGHMYQGRNILFQELISVLKRSFDFVLTRGGEELPMYQVEF